METRYREMLVTYNREDCEGLRLLVNEVANVKFLIDTSHKIDFANKPKRHETEAGKEIHYQFETILKFSHFRYDSRKIKFRKDDEDSEPERKKSSKRGYQGQRKVRPSPDEVLWVNRGKSCPKCGFRPLAHTWRISKRLIIDIVPTNTGLKKTIVK